MEFKIEKAKLDDLLAEVQGELNQLLKSEGEALSKGVHDDEPGEESSGSDAGKPAEDLEEPEASEGSPAEASPAPEAEATPAQEEIPGEEAQEEPEAAPSLEDLTAAYAELTPEQLHMHLEAVKLAAEQVFGPTEATENPDQEAASMGEPAAPAAPVGKAEKKEVKKSEKDAEIELLKAQIEEQGKALNQLVEVLSTPIRKSVRGVSELEYISKDGAKASVTETLSKSEITQRLRSKARDVSLSKSDRDLIKGFYAGTVEITKLEHLLASAK